MGWESVCLLSVLRAALAAAVQIPGVIPAACTRNCAATGLGCFLCFPSHKHPLFQFPTCLSQFQMESDLHLLECFHIPDHCILGGCATVLPQIYRFGISLPELPQLPPADGTLTFPLQDECEEQPQTRLCGSIQQLGDTKGRRPQFVLSVSSRASG